VIAGLLAPELAQLLVYVGIDRIGAARSSAIMPIGPFSAIVLAGVPGRAPVGQPADRRRASWAAPSSRPSRSVASGAAGAAGPDLSSWGAVAFGLRDVTSRWGLQTFRTRTVAAVVATMTSAVLIAATRSGAAELRADRVGSASCS
jgi:hypothetical protein